MIRKTLNLRIRFSQSLTDHSKFIFKLSSPHVKPSSNKYFFFYVYLSVVLFFFLENLYQN